MFRMLFFTLVNVHWPYQHVGSEAMFGIGHHHQNCSLQESKNGIDAGTARNVRVECKYNSSVQSFYDEISWEFPKPTKTPVMAYRVYIMYGFSKHICFQVPKFQRKLEFTKKLGFRSGWELKYAVTPQPIVRVHGQFHAKMREALGCPVGIKLLPLQHIAIPVGTNFSFQCQFEERPVPNARVKWLFTKDKTNCTKRMPLERSEHIAFSKDKHVLHILRATKQHVGCYVLIADNGFEIKEQKGYLTLNTSKILPPKTKRDNWEVLIPLFSVVIGMIVLIIVIFVIVMKTCLRTTKPEVAKESEHLKKSVYISHCTEDENEKLLLAKFASIIKSYSIDVIIDFCSEVQIDSVGGFSRWIPNNIKRADKVMVVLTQSYMIALESSNSDECCQSENVRKVNSDFNFINNILYDDLHYSKKILIVSKGVQPSEFPYVFKNKFFIKFPEELDMDKDLHFRSIMGVLLEEEPIQLQNGQPHVMTVDS